LSTILAKIEKLHFLRVKNANFDLL